MKIVILGQVISKKNSQRIIRRGKFPSIRPSKAYDKYAKEVLPQLKGLRYTGKYPLEMRYYLYRRTLGKFDYNNLSQGIQDLLVQAGVIDDDNMCCLIPVVLGWEKCRDNPRVELELVEHVAKAKSWITGETK